VARVQNGLEGAAQGFVPKLESAAQRPVRNDRTTSSVMSMRDKRILRRLGLGPQPVPDRLTCQIHDGIDAAIGKQLIETATRRP